MRPSGRARRGLLGAGLVAVVTLVAPARAERLTLSTGPFLVSCASTGQLCDPPKTLEVADDGRRVRIRKITYVAPEAHCSSGRILVSLDGREVARLRFVAAKERTTVRRRLRLSPGSAHLFEFRFEGRPGGCNVGYVASWGGEITLTGRR